MKTDKFGDTVRRKLEGISPEFQESDWVGMQNYMRAQTPSTIWQKYGSWMGYAAAASVTSLMAFGYIYQVKKNTELISDVKALKTQIEDVRRIASTAPVADTVYLVQKEFNEQPTNYQDFRPSSELTAATHELDADRSENIIESVGKSDNVQDLAANAESGQPLEITETEKKTGVKVRSQDPIAERPNEAIDSYSAADATIASNNNTESAANQRHTSQLNIEPLETAALQPGSSDYHMKYALHSRISPRQVRKALHIPETTVPSVSSQAVLAKNQPKVESAAKATEVNKTETVIPQIPIKTPYRFGAGMQFEKGSRTTSVLAEFLIGKKFAISSGFSWLKVKSMEFYNERIFREKNNHDFKRSHPEEIPQLVQVYNIKVEPTSLQIPLTVAFRNTIAHKVDYYVSAGTNITIKSSEKYSFDCLRMGPGPSFSAFSKSFESKKEVSPINSVNVALGIEKSWHPIVVQAEGYLYTYFTPINPMINKTGPGFRVKVLYQVGKKR